MLEFIKNLRKEKIMSAKITTPSRTVLYVIAFLVIVVAFLLLGGGTWIRGGMMNGNRFGMHNWNWAQVLVGFGLGYLACWLISRRRW